MLLDYTTYADIRAALGVSEEELDDVTLGLDLHLTLLEDGLDQLSATLRSDWEALSAPDTQTADELKFAALFKLYCTYAVAFNLLDSAELFGFLKVADGRASTERVPGAYKTLRAGVTAMYQRVKARMLAAYLVVNPAAVVAAPATTSFISSVGIAADPVTNV